MNKYIIKFGEIGLKGKNRGSFERTLIRNIRYSLLKSGKAEVVSEHGRIYVITDMDGDSVENKLSKIPGIVGFSLAVEAEKDIRDIALKAIDMVKSYVKGGKKLSFKINARRSDKSFEFTSMEINKRIGAMVLEALSEYAFVDVHNPELELVVEISQNKAFLYKKPLKGVGGLPVGSSGKGVLLLSGGIDSPVAGWMMMKRGLKIFPVYFHSFPYVTDRVKEKVKKLASILSEYQPGLKLYVVNFTEIQTAIMENCDINFLTIIMRRRMVEIASLIAKRTKASALITGENLGQVASQTIQSVNVISKSTELPILRPLIGFDKTEIITLAKKIGTYETSVLPYDDCCAVFVPKHPVTKPTPEKVKVAERGFDFLPMIKKAVYDVEIIEF